VLLATASAILILAVIAAAILLLRSYRPTPVSVVERALMSHDVRAKVNTDVRLRLLMHQQRRAGRDHPADTLDVAPFSAPVTAPISAPVTAPISAPVASPISAPVTAPFSAPVASRITTLALPTSPGIHLPSLLQSSLVHNQAAAPRPGSYFRMVESPSQEATVSSVRGPWASEIVTLDGRITLPDSDIDVELAWRASE
jgi:hypothetical protein